MMSMTIVLDIKLLMRTNSLTIMKMAVDVSL